MIKVRSCDELLRMLLVCITAICLRSVLRCIIFFFLILDTYLLDTVYVSKGRRIRGCFAKPNGIREQKRLGNTDTDIVMV